MPPRQHTVGILAGFAKLGRETVNQSTSRVLLTPLPVNANGCGSIHCRELLGSSLKYYDLDAA
jgi:hypothetical protein